MAGPSLHRWLIPAAVTVVFMASSCLFDSEPAEPGYPSQLEATLSFGDVGAPAACKCMPGSEVALIAADSRIGVVQLQTGQLLASLDLGVSVDDLSDSQAGGFAWAVADSLLYRLDLSGPSLLDPMRLDGRGLYVTASSSENAVLVLMDDDSLFQVDVDSLKGWTVPGLALPGCQGLEYGGGGTLYAVLGSEGVIAGFNIDGWNEIGRVSIPGDAIDMFPGPTGYVCAIVNGSNELWFIRTSDCKLYRMITFPETPVAAASVPDGVYGFGSCPGTGLMVVSESGQVELRSMDYGIPSGIDITPDGERAVLCNAETRTVYILVR